MNTLRTTSSHMPVCGSTNSWLLYNRVAVILGFAHCTGFPYKRACLHYSHVLFLYFPQGCPRVLPRLVPLHPSNHHFSHQLSSYGFVSAREWRTNPLTVCVSFQPETMVWNESHGAVQAAVGRFFDVPPDKINNQSPGHLYDDNAENGETECV